MTDILLESRRGLRQRAFQALMSLEYEGDLVEACRFAYSYDKDEEADKAAEADAQSGLRCGPVQGRLGQENCPAPQKGLDSGSSDAGREKYPASGDL